VPGPQLAMDTVKGRSCLDCAYSAHNMVNVTHGKHTSARPAQSAVDAIKG
jgi:hypothetical protein